MIIVISIAAFLVTLLGGIIALRFKDKLHLIIGFSAGAVLGLVFFDLIPESIKLGSQFYDVNMISVMIAVGFLSYLILDRVVTMHSHSHDGCHDDEHVTSPNQNFHSTQVRRGILGAGSLSVHSFLDGVVIGLAFQISTAIGAVVTIAVLVHDFSDGINTVSLILKNRGESKQAFRWLLVDAIAPVLGATSTMFFSLPEQGLSIVLALFSGFFLYIGASDLIPESHHAHPKFLTTIMTLLGVTVLFFAIKFAGV